MKSATSTCMSRPTTDIFAVNLIPAAFDNTKTFDMFLGIQLIMS